MRLLIPAVLAAALVAPASAFGWSWPVGGPVLTFFSFDRAHPYAAGPAPPPAPAPGGDRSPPAAVPPPAPAGDPADPPSPPVTVHRPIPRARRTRPTAPAHVAAPVRLRVSRRDRPRVHGVDSPTMLHPMRSTHATHVGSGSASHRQGSVRGRPTATPFPHMPDAVVSAAPAGRRAG